MTPVPPGRFAFRASTREGAEDWRRRFRRALEDALGLTGMAREMAGHRVTARRVERVDRGVHVREKWYVATEPGVQLPVWVLHPARPGSRLPIVITPHGHNHPQIYAGITQNAEEEALIRDGDRDITVQAAREGYIGILPTARGFGETRGPKDLESGKLSSCRDRLVHGLLAGRTPIGERVWDVSRIIDWAVEAFGADGSRIAITGNSGGGTTSLFAAACEPRIKVAVPSGYFCTFAGSIGSIHHCECNYVPGMLTLGEMYDVAGLVAPRPFLAIAGKADDIFPIRHTRTAFARLRRIYRVFGASDRCELFIGSGGHRYYQAGSWPFVRRFL